MRTIYTQVVQHVQTVPLFVWGTLMLYGGVIWAIDRFGLPFKKHTTGGICQEKYVSHGIARTQERVPVYDLWYTEANAITVLGILGLIVSFGLVYHAIYEAAIPALFLIAAAYSDLMDGKTCLRWDCHSDIGALLDPIRDRLGIVLLFVCIVKEVGVHPFWIIPCMFLIAFEIGIAQIALVARERGVCLNSHGPGKQRQIVHIVMIAVMFISMYLLDLSGSAHVRTTMICTTIMSVASMLAFLHYKKRYSSP